MPYTKAHGYATNSCCLSIDNAETKSLDADRLHQSTATVVRTVPNRPLQHTHTHTMHIHSNTATDSKQINHEREINMKNNKI